jgi:hypothetical protein
VIDASGYGRGVSHDQDSGELLLAVVVELAPGGVEAGLRYEDAVLGLLDRHGAVLERRLRSTDAATEVHVIRFRSRAGLASFLADPDRTRLRAEVGDAVPVARVIEVRDL